MIRRYLVRNIDIQKMVSSLKTR